MVRSKSMGPKDELRRLTVDNPPLRAALLAPQDDEPLTEEEIAAVEEAKEELARGEYVTLDAVKRQLGLA